VSEQQTAAGEVAAVDDDATAGAAPERIATAGDGATGGSAAGGVAAVDDVEEALRDVVDPELGINVVDLGLVYGLTVDEANVAIIDMTLTSAACPLQDVIEDQIRTATSSLVNDFRVNWVWMPPWGPDKITDDGREQLRALGFNV
jgi:metal-sulfur cluster biosynthetic enzyme